MHTGQGLLAVLPATMGWRPTIFGSSLPTAGIVLSDDAYTQTIQHHLGLVDSLVDEVQFGLSG